MHLHLALVQCQQDNKNEIGNEKCMSIDVR